MEVLAQIALTVVALYITAGFLANKAKRHIACISIMQGVLMEVRRLSHTAIWSTSYSTITFGSEPQLEIILNCETSDTSIIFSVNSKNSVCEFYEKSIGEPDRYDFSISCPAHYFDTEFLRTATTEHKYWKEKESSHYDRFLYPPTGLLISRVASENFSTPTDPSYSHERRMAKRGAGARYPILEY